MCITRRRVCREKSALRPRVISRPEIEQIGARIILLSGEGEDTASAACTAHHTAIRLVTPRQRHTCAGISELAHTPQRIGQMIRKPTQLLFANAAQAIQIGVVPIRQHLRQARIEIQRVGCRYTVSCLPQSVAQAVVGKGVDIRPLRDGNQPIGGIVLV